MKDKELDRISKQAATADADAAAAAKLHDEALRRVDDEAASLRQRLAQAEGHMRAREKEVAVLQRQLGTARAGDDDRQADWAKTAEQLTKAEAELAQVCD